MRHLVLTATIAILAFWAWPSLAKPALVLRCEPHVLAEGSALHVEIEGPRGRSLRELGVLTPRDKFLFIAFAPENGANTSHPPIPSEEFLAKRLAVLKVSSLTGVDLGEDTTERVFVAPGQYKFVASENLETEDDAGENISCVVRYGPASPAGA